jgi:hypothetical protein
LCYSRGGGSALLARQFALVIGFDEEIVIDAQESNNAPPIFKAVSQTHVGDAAGSWSALLLPNTG